MRVSLRLLRFPRQPLSFHPRLPPLLPIMSTRATSQESDFAKSSIYTRTGDAGMTSLYNGERRLKSELRFEVLGALDELNAHIGLAREFGLQDGSPLDDVLVHVQSRLLDAGSSVATPPSSSTAQLTRVEFPPHEVEGLERKIDELDAQLPPLKNFILPSGGLMSAQLHVARTVCRRAERLLVPLAHADSPAEAQVDPTLLRYMNRLSDFLFVAARFAAQTAGRPEQSYKKGRGLLGQDS